MKHSFATFLLAGTILSFASMEAIAGETVPENVPGAEVHHKLDEAAMRQKMKEHHEEMSQKMADDLNLTDEQRAKADKIHKDGRKEIEPMMEQMKNMRQKMDEKRKLNLEEFKKILTPEQKEKFEKLKEEYRKKYVPGIHQEVDDRPWAKKKPHPAPTMPAAPNQPK